MTSGSRRALSATSRRSIGASRRRDLLRARERCRLVACGGGRRDRLYTGSGESEGDSRALDPATEPAKVWRCSSAPTGRAGPRPADRRGVRGSCATRGLPAARPAGHAPRGSALSRVRLRAARGSRGRTGRRGDDRLCLDAERSSFGAAGTARPGWTAAVGCRAVGGVKRILVTGAAGRSDRHSSPGC